MARTKNKFTHEFLKALQEAVKDTSKLNTFLEVMLTPGEYKEIPKRWQIIRRLHKGEPQRKIAKSLQVGIGTVTRGARELLDKEGELTQILNKISKKT